MLTPTELVYKFLNELESSSLPPKCYVVQSEKYALPHYTNGRIQPVRAVDLMQVSTPDRALGCNSLFVDYTTVGCFEYNDNVVDNLSHLEVVRVNQQVGIPGIVRNGVVVPQSSQPLPEGTHVEIRVEPGAVPAGLKSEIEAWDKASDESWKWIESLEANER